jgi:hypothetical protein
MTATLDLAAELEAIVGQLDADQLDHVGAALRARAAERRRQAAEMRAVAADQETTDAFVELEPLAVRLKRRAVRARTVGIDDDLIGCSVARELLELGHDETEVCRLVARAGIDWCLRSAEERMVAAAAELLASGWDPEVVRGAFEAVGAPS